MDSKIDRRKNAEKYESGKKPSPRSEYFGKSYGQLKRESSHSKALEKAKGERKPKRSEDEMRHSRLSKMKNIVPALGNNMNRTK
jgi:hypothetical protein